MSAQHTEMIYVIGVAGGDTVKIGRSTQLARRVGDIQRMSPVPLLLLWSHPGDHELETRLHRHFAASRIHGEWFTFPDDDPVQLVRKAVEEQPWAQKREVPQKPRPAATRAPRMSDEEFSARLEAARSARVNVADTRALEEAIGSRLSEISSIRDCAARMKASRDLRGELAKAEQHFVAMQRDSVIKLKDSGLSWRQVGELLGMSGSRAEQIARHRRAA